MVSKTTTQDHFNETLPKNSAQFTSFRVSSSLDLIRFVQNKVELVVVETEALLVSGSRWISSAV